MSDPAARNLIDIEFYRTSMELEKDDPNLKEELVELLITAATDAIEAYCNREFITPAAAIDEIFDGTGEINYIVKHGRINDATAPVISYWTGTAWDVADTTAYPREYEYESGEVYFTDGGVFGINQKGWKIAYKYGWTAIADLPFDLKRACADLIKWMRTSTDKQGVGSESFGDSSVSYTTNQNKLVTQAWPLHITEILNRYKRIHSG